MKQLSGLDNLFLALERGNQFLHVAGLGIYDPSTAPGGKVRFKSVLNHFASRLDESKAFRRRLITVPKDIDRPYWVEDGAIDLEYHVRHIALPHPGDWRQLCIQVARIHSRPLDQSKPLWEVYVIEGLRQIPGVPKDSFALYSKFHHAVVDGQAGAELLMAVHSLTPDLPEQQKPSSSVIVERDPTIIELYTRAVTNRSHQIAEASRVLTAVGHSAVDLGRALLKMKFDKGLRWPSDGEPSVVPSRAPVTRFGQPLSPHRVLEAQGFPLEDFERIRAHFGDVTIDDIFLTVVGGAIQRYLTAKNELPDQPINALTSMSPTACGANGGMIVPLHTQIGDAAQRLKAVRRGAKIGQEITGLIGRDLPEKLMNVMPTVATRAIVKRSMIPRINVVASNVSGSSAPLYMAGARMVQFFPVSAIVDGVGLNLTGLSYDGKLWIGAVSCRKIMPDPAFFGQCLHESFNELLDLATPEPEPTPSHNNT